MGLTYVIPDLHGRLDLLEKALSRILEHAGNQTSHVVTLGDYVDRGPNSRGVIEFLTQWSFPNLQLVALKGNHEAMMWEACTNLVEAEWWIGNGGGETLASYGCEYLLKVPLRRIIPDHHLLWIDELPLVHADLHRVFVHAGVDPRISLGQQSDRTLLWKRYPKGAYSGHGRRHVVHGHQGDEKAPLVFKGRTNLDGMAWKTGRLVVGIFSDDQPGGAAEFLDVR